MAAAAPPAAKQGPPPRKSVRLQEQPLPPAQTPIITQYASKILKPDWRTAQSSSSNFLAALYHEIDAVLSNTQTSRTYDAIETFIRRARLARFLRSLPAANARSQPHGTRSTSLTLLNESNRASFRALATNISPELAPQLTRIGELFSIVHAPVVCACACSKVFRDLVGADDVAGFLSWNDIRRLIIDNVYSIELFAISRGLDWIVQLSQSDAHYRSLLAENDAFWKVLHKTLQPAGTLTATSIGIPQGENNTRHPNVPRGAYNPHVWHLPDPVGPADRCTVRYKVTKDALNYSPPVAVAGKKVGNRVDAPQEDISEAVLLADYPWRYANEWPVNNKDPRYATNDSGECSRCTMTQTICDVVAAGGQQTTVRTCDCTFDQFQANAGYAPVPLIQLVSGPLGTGVRALQAIHKSQYLNVYIGEMYPKKRVDNKVYILPRYKDSAGECYILQCSIAAVNSSVKRKQNSYESFYIDPAVRGNWTRFINHSCDSNTRFSTENIGQRNLILIEALRDIAFGEIITVNYGSEYFGGKTYPCACRAAKCTAWNWRWNNRIANPNGTGFVDAAGHRVTRPASLRAAVHNNPQDQDLPAWARVPGFQPTPTYVAPRAVQASAPGGGVKKGRVTKKKSQAKKGKGRKK